MDHVFTVAPEDAGTRLDVFLAGCLGLSRSRVKKLIDEGFAVLRNETVLKPSYHVEINDVIELTFPLVSEPEFLPENIPLDIVFKDEHLVVVNKPPGMVVHPGRNNVTGTLASALLYHYGTLSGVSGPKRPGIVHRLDMNTSGLIVIALSDEVHTHLARMIKDREVKRVYTTFVWGHPQPESGTIEAHIGRHPKKPTLQAIVEMGKHAVTHYELIEHYYFLSKMRITLQTGRTH